MEEQKLKTNNMINKILRIIPVLGVSLLLVIIISLICAICGDDHVFFIKIMLTSTIGIGILMLIEKSLS